MRKLTVVIVAVLVMMIAAVQAQAATIHMHFFESIDIELQQEGFQIFSVSMLQGEQLTVVAYGLEEGVIPGVTLLDTVGSTLAEDFNESGDDVAWVQVDIPENGMYTFLISRQTEVGGFMRVMAFEGEPIDEDITFLDDLDPFETSRAFMIGGDPENPLGVTVDLVEPEDETIVLPEVFASRGDAGQLPTVEDMITPVPVGDTEEWLNNQVTPFYTINIRPFPEIVTTTSFNHDGNFDVAAQIFQVFDYLLIIGQGGEPQRVERDFCLSGDFEVVGITADGEFYQVVDPNSDSGFRLVPVDTLNVPLDSEGCQRVQEVNVDTPDTNGRGTGGGTGGFPIPPAGDPPQAGSTGGSGSVSLNDNPPDNPPAGGTGGLPPTFTISGFACNLETQHLVVSYGNAVSSMNLTVSYGNNFNHSLPAAAGFTSIELSDPVLGAGSNSFSYVVTDGGGNTLASGTTSVDCSAPAPTFTVAATCYASEGNEFTVYWSGVPAGETQLMLPDLDNEPTYIDDPLPNGSYTFYAGDDTWGPGTASLASSGLTAPFPFVDCDNPPPAQFTISGYCFESYAGVFEATIYWSDGVNETLIVPGFPDQSGASGSYNMSANEGDSFGNTNATYTPSTGVFDYLEPFTCEGYVTE